MQSSSRCRSGLKPQLHAPLPDLCKGSSAAVKDQRLKRLLASWLFPLIKHVGLIFQGPSLCIALYSGIKLLPSLSED